MALVGVVCEYNPFHNGHASQLRRVREDFGPDTGIVCLMSGSYVQRGEPAIFPKDLRAEAAVLGGADLVLELPLTAALRSAEGFAAAGVEILTAFGCDYLSFGSECGDRNILMSTAKANLDPRFDALLRAGLSAGCSYPKARERALEQLQSLPLEDRAVRGTARFYPQLRSYAAEMGSSAQVSAPTAPTDEAGPQGFALSRPNDILGVEYCKAILRQGSPMLPHPILRPGSYHAETLDPAAPSATALRAALLSAFRGGHWPPAQGEDSQSRRCETGAHTGRGNPSSDWRAAVPACLHDLYASAPVHTMAAGERAVLAILRTLPDAAFEALPFGAEGLWSKLMKNARACASVEEILAATKSKRYTLSRLRRMLLCAVLGLTAADLDRPAPYIRVLAFNDRGRAALRERKKRQSGDGSLIDGEGAASRPALTLINAGETPQEAAYYALESRAADLYTLFSRGPAAPGAAEARQRVVYAHMPDML